MRIRRDMTDNLDICEQCQITKSTEEEKEFYDDHNLVVFVCVPCLVNNHYSTMLEERIEYPLLSKLNELLRF